MPHWPTELPLPPVTATETSPWTTRLRSSCSTRTGPVRSGQPTPVALFSVLDGFRYCITHTYVTRHVGDSTQTATLVGARVCALNRFADRPSETSEFCEHCDARLRVVLRSAADVRQRRRTHRLLWPVWALLAVMSGWGLVHVLRTGDGLGYDDLFGLLFTAAATVLLGYGTLRSLVLSQGFGTPEVTRTDDREPYGVRHALDRAGARRRVSAKRFPGRPAPGRREQSGEPAADVRVNHDRFPRSTAVSPAASDRAV